MRRLFTQFSFPGGIPSHVAPETPGSIHEGGELGYALVARLRGGVRQPGAGRRRGRRRRRGRDGAAGGQLARQQVPGPGTGRRRAADPAPQRLQDRQPDRAGADPARGAARPAARLRPHAVPGRGRRPGRRCTSSSPPPSTAAWTRSPSIQRRARADGEHRAAALADDRAGHPQGLDRPEGGRRRCPVEGTWRSHQVPFANARGDDGHRAVLEEWMRSYRPEELFDDDGAPGARRPGPAPGRASGG